VAPGAFGFALPLRKQAGAAGTNWACWPQGWSTLVLGSLQAGWANSYT